MFENMTFEKILNDMLDRVPDTVDKREGSIIYDAISPAAAEMAKVYIDMDTALNESFADTASREFLIRRASERGIVPKPATNSVLQVDFSFSNDGSDMLGARFNLDGLNYIVTTNLLPNGFYNATCENAGIVGNKNSGTLIPIDYIDGLVSATITGIVSYGSDEEGTEELRQRYFQSFGGVAFAGNRQDYMNKCNAIDGVIATKVTPVWNGAGTVKLTILTDDYLPTNNTLISQVQNNISSVTPIGHIVTVDTPEIIYVNFNIRSISISDDSNITDVKESIFQQLESYMRELRKKWSESIVANNTIQLHRNQFIYRCLSANGVENLETYDIQIGDEVTSNNWDIYNLPTNKLPVLSEVNIY